MSGIELATAYVTIVPEGSRIAPEFRKQFGAVEKDADRAGQRSGKKFGGKFSGSAGSLIKGALAGVVTVKALGLLKDSVSAASDLNESATKTQAIFGAAKSRVDAFADTAATKLGQSKLAALDAAASIGAFGKAAGLTGPKLADFSTGLVGLSSDLASFYNTDPEQAVGAISAALRGESEPIRAYGVLLDEASLKAEALSLGLLKATKDTDKIKAAQNNAIVAQRKYNEALKKNGKGSDEALTAESRLASARSRLQKATEGSIGPLTQQQKVLAAQSAIYKQTKDAQGDFARTSDGLANKQRTLKAQFENVKGELGQGLLPLVTEGTAKLSDFVTGFQDGTGAGGDMRDVLQDVAGAGKKVFKFFDAIPGPIKKTGAELLIAAFVIGKVSTGLIAAKVAATGLVTNMRTAAASTAVVSAKGAALGAGLRNLAGAGGFLALQNATTQANRGLGTLEGAAGGAALGFAVGGPLGAGVGAVAGGLLGLAKSGDHSSKILQNFTTDASKAIPPLETYAQALKRTKDAVVGLSNAEVAETLIKNGAIKAAGFLGLTADTVTKAAQGNATAIIKVNKAISKGYLSGEGSAAAVRLAGALGITQDALKANVVEANQLLLAQGKYNKVLKGVPKDAQTRIGTIGLETAEKHIVGLTRKYGLIKPEIKTILKAAGVKTTKDQIQGIIDKAAELDKKGKGKHAQIAPSVDPLAARKGLAGLLTTLGSSAKNHPPLVRPKVEAKGANADLLHFIGGLQRTADSHPIRIKTIVENAGLGGGRNNDGTVNRDGNPATGKGRVNGGPVTAGQPYIVGEKRPELFIPNQNGRIIPRVSETSAAAAGGSGPAVFRLYDGVEFEGYVTAVAEDAIARAS